MCVCVVAISVCIINMTGQNGSNHILPAPNCIYIKGLICGGCMPSSKTLYLVHIVAQYLCMSLCCPNNNSTTESRGVNNCNM